MALFKRKTKKAKEEIQKEVKVEETLQAGDELQNTFNEDTLDILVEDGEVENVQD